jgi:hypothetical protein
MSTRGVYDHALGAFGGADIDLVNHRIVAAALDLSAGYSVDLAADEYLTDIPAGSVVSSVPLTGKSVGDGLAFDADDVTFASVAAGVTVGAIVLYRDTGFANSSPLIYYTDAAAGLPAVGDGDDVVVLWPTPIFSRL